MKLGKLAAGATALALSLALVPSVASAAETGLTNKDYFMIMQAKNPPAPGVFPEGVSVYAYTANLTATRNGNPVDTKQVHYGDQIVVTTGKPTLANGSEHDWKEPFSTKQTLKIHSGFTSNPTPPVGEKYLWQPTGVVNTSETKTVAPTEEGKFTYTVGCKLKPGERFAFLEALYDKTVKDTSPTTYGSGYDDAHNVALLSFTINDPEGAANCAKNDPGNPGTDPQPEATQNELDQKAKELQDKEYGDNLTKAALANRALVKDRYVSDIDKLLQQDAQKYAALEPYKKQISDALAAVDTAVAAAQDPLSDSATKNAMAKFRRAYLDAWEQALKIQNPELAQQYQALQRLYYQARTSGNRQLVNEVTEMQNALNKAWPAWFSPESTAENQYSFMVINTENKDLTAYTKTVKEQITSLKAALDKQGANSDNHDKKVEQKPVKKDSLPPTGAIALVATALAGTLVAVGGGITYLSRRSKQRS
ncbi:LPXTG cell wall anchor domain-containing protein [Varibaculum cambriense]|uniref:LPXTG cell wall anchor domain-containing protein n=1 Tax=Varibaculum cambriense TaxID=184870 RepID=UPI000C7CB039|nr:LPXTG cell wall anchor domain-containing protein [Varibaculum cambriense]WIK88607.1 LPXTG cell wall anchor domain-containing protein [Varibaculum cambriense]